MDRGVCPDGPGGSPEKNAGVEDGQDNVVDETLEPHNDDLDLRTGVLGPDTNDLDGYLDNEYQDETPPSSALCSRSCSRDSCVNISQSISLDFSNGSEPDLSHIGNIEQCVKESLIAQSASRHRIRRISELLNKESSTLPRWAMFQSSRKTPYGRRFGLTRRTPRSLRSQKSTSTQAAFNSSVDPSHSTTEILSQEPSAADNFQNQPENPANLQDSVAPFDHIMTFDPTSPMDTLSDRSRRTNQAPKSSHSSTTNALLDEATPTEAPRGVSFSPIHINTSEDHPSLNSPHPSNLSITPMSPNLIGESSPAKTSIDGYHHHSASATSLPQTRSSSKCGLLRQSESDTRFDNINLQSAPVEVPMKKRFHKVRVYKVLVTKQNTSGDLSRRDPSINSRVLGRQPAKPSNAKGRVRPSDDETVRPSKSAQTSSRTTAPSVGPTIRRDVRHHPDSGVGSSASSTFSPSPRGPTSTHHYITKRRFEKTGGNPAAIHPSSNQQTSISNNLKGAESKSHPTAHDSKKEEGTIEEVNEDQPKLRPPNETSQMNRRTLKTSGALVQPPDPASNCNRACHHRTRPSARIALSTGHKALNPNVPKSNDIGNRSQLERDFHCLLESLGFVCRPNEPENSWGCQSSSKDLKPPFQQNPSLYSIPKANFVDASKSRSQSAETNRAGAAAEEKTEPAGQTADSRRASSLSSVARRKTRPPILANAKPINLDQIRSVKQTVDNAIADQKIFVVYGAFPSIREALKSRGWIEKRPYPERKTVLTESDQTALRNRGSRELFQHGGVRTLQSEDPAILALIEGMSTNPNEIDFEEELTERAIVGRMLRNVDPNFIWTVKCEAMDWKRLKKRQLINRFPRAFFATKIGLSTFLRQMHWFSEEGISMTRFPRCYNICQADDMEAFVEDFRLTACLGLLKIVVERFQKLGDAGVQDENGKVPKYAMEFAISRCVEYLVANNHADLDWAAAPSVHCHQWDQFLAWSYELRTDKGRFSKTCSEPSPQVMNDTAKDLIKRMSEVWPQLDLDGVLNIWILKPGAKSRGRGIHLINRLDAITEHVSPQHIRDARYVAQKYIERPLIIFGTKFDIRQWFLVTSVYPMTIWMYRESYLRFCSQSFSLTNMHESVHLCNNAVQAKYKNGKRDPALPDENMWDCYTFQTYLRALGRPELWDTVIYPGMRQGIIGTLLASQEHMDRRGDCFELFGADFMLTEDFNPWLIEINSCPCMAPSTSVTARMCAQCLEDVIKVVIDRRNDKNADTGRFELVYKQHIPPPPPYLGMSLSVRGRRVNNGSSSNTNTASSPGQSPTKQGSRRVRRPASDAPRRRQRHPRIVLPTTVGAARYRFKDKLSNDSEATLPPDVDEVTSSGSETDSSTTTDVPTSTDVESRPPRTPTPTCPPSRMENLRCSHRPSAVAAMVAKQKARQRSQHNVLAAVGHGVIQPSEDNHKKSMELLREWRQRARTSGLLTRSSTNKLGSLSSANSAEMLRRMSSSSNGSGLMAVGVTLDRLLR